MTALPAPTRERWQPLRAGLVDLFYYDVEEFWFHDGRLLLRGNNGTGKSKVLALLLPFLLDGELSAHRVEPDADPKKRMEWNLLLGGEHPNSERLGYTWLEFGRLTDGGDVEFRTIGCGLKAVAGRGIAKHWFFLTDQRIGPELRLVDATGIALAMPRLADALAGRGTVYERRVDYRRAVDENLFGLGEQRYGALVDLLVQLRQPQLSKRPSETALSGALTEALPPLDQAVVADVAEAFRSLEEDRDELAAMTEAHGSAAAFLGHYRRYAAVASRRRAERPRRAEQRYRESREALASAQEQYRAADEAAGAAQQRLDELRTESERLVARESALRASPEMRSAHELERVAAEAGRRRQDAESLAAREHTLAGIVERRRAAAEAAAGRSTSAVDELAVLRQAATVQSVEAGIGAGHATEVDARLPTDGDPATIDERLRAPRRAADELIGRRRRAVRHVQGLLDAQADAGRVESGARAAVERLAGAMARLAERRAVAGAALEEAGRELVDATRSHLGAATELTVPDPEAVLAALDTWCATLASPNPARAAADDTGRVVTAELAGAGATFDQARTTAEATAAELAAEIARLEAGEHGAPPAPHTRGPAARTDRPGAPLWQLVDFADRVDAGARAGIEAALEASGMLDAWLGPDGSLRAVDGDLLIAPDPGAHRPQPSLATVLVPAVDQDDPMAGAVPPAAVADVLAAIGLGTGSAPTWVAADGRFRNGVLIGGWSKPAARYIGRGAREAARRARLVELRTEAAGVATTIAGLVADRDRIDARRARLVEELAALPDDADLRDAHAAVAALATEHVGLVDERAEADAALATATDDLRTATDVLHTAAADVGLTPAAGALHAVGVALESYGIALAGLWPAARAVVGAHAAEAAAVLERTEAAADHTTARERAAVADRDARAATAAFEALQETVGAAVRELQELLAAVLDEQRAVADDTGAATAARESAIGERGLADGLRRGAEEALSAAAVERAEAAESLRRFATTGLLAVALPELDIPALDGSWAPEPTVRLARQVDQDLESTAADDSAWDRVARRVNDELKTLSDTLARQGNTASAQLLDDGIVVDVVFRGRPATVPELTGALGDEVADRRRLLDEREREILENHLVNEVASTLQELIGEAERQVRLMNTELSDRPTSTGMRLRLDWRPVKDGPAGLAEARARLLRQTSDAWSAGDRAAVGGFLQSRIAEVRARDEAGTWLDHLTTALDYRGWHRFVIERYQNGDWRPATGPASGGERVLAASVPLFAAASAHYASAGNPHAPRLVMLDEAFAGVDDNARARYLGLLAAFDLDVVMTSEREWGCYPEVPGLAIAQLARTDGVPAVLVTNWRWDGRQRRRMARPVSVPAAEPAPEPAGTGTGSLFDDL